ncbi:hypothetical protein F5144DRAFT_321134 [Chaetomium tenue]|uniref:Uncharacterized protein n=1 Tax=Chaetomium tenue TaxID=1854479 RepID=A0ACB7P7Y9_9PEZI|nr:hypothetical protein F5144DRAFT_321134 [Chaetomium globosum]
MVPAHGPHETKQLATQLDGLAASPYQSSPPSVCSTELSRVSSPSDRHAQGPKPADPEFGPGRSAKEGGVPAIHPNFPNKWTNDVALARDWIGSRGQDDGRICFRAACPAGKSHLTDRPKSLKGQGERGWMSQVAWEVSPGSPDFPDVPPQRIKIQKAARTEPPAFLFPMSHATPSARHCLWRTSPSCPAILFGWLGERR